MNQKLKNTLQYLLIFSPLIALLSYYVYYFAPEGYLIHIDVTEGLSVQNLYQRYIYTYSHDWGEALAEKARIPLFYLIFGIFKLSMLGDSYFVKIKILVLVTTTALAYSIAIFKLLNFLQKSAQNRTQEMKTQYRKMLILATVLGATYYLTNYWFSNRLMHFYLFFTSATIPVFFYLWFSYLYEEKAHMKKVLFLAIFSAVFTATPHTVLFQGLILITLSATYIFYSEHPISQRLKRLLAGVFLLVTSYILLNAYWLLPFVLSTSKPDAVPSETIFEFLGKNSTTINSLRLTGYWLTELKDYFSSNFYISTLQQGLSILPAVILLVAVLVLVRKSMLHKVMALNIGILFILSWFLATVNEFTKPFYFYLMFESPVSSFGWLFREADKFGVMLSFLYSLSMTLLLINVNNKARKIFLITSVSVVLISNTGFLHSVLYTYYKSQRIPRDFFEVAEILGKEEEPANVFWYPEGTKPYWANTEEVRYVFTNKIDTVPSLTTRSDVINFFNSVMEHPNPEKYPIAEILRRFGIKYLILRDDTNIFNRDELYVAIEKEANFTKIYESKILRVYKNNLFEGLSTAYLGNIKTNRGLEVFESLLFDGEEKQVLTELNLEFTDKPGLSNALPNFYMNREGHEAPEDKISKFVHKLIYPYNYLHKKDDGNPGYWKLGSLENLNHAETNVFFERLGLDIKQYDYQNGIAIARDGWQKLYPQEQGDNIPLTFSKHPNLMADHEVYKYTSREEDFLYIWNIIRSDKVEVSGIRGMEFTANAQDMKDDIVPHFKIYFYNSEEQIMDIQAFYPSENHRINSVIKVPEHAQTADISIWSRSTPGQPYGYSVTEMRLSNISRNIKPVTMSFTADPKCYQECHVWVRPLMSRIGGDLIVNIAQQEHYLNTKVDQDGLFLWHKITTEPLKELTNPLEITLQNISGFNAVNALVFLTPEESLQLEQLNMEYDQVAAVNNLKAQTQDTQISLQSQEINPTKYLVKIENLNLPAQANTNNKGFILNFAKPYSPNWLLNGQPAKLTNGYLNGWYLENPQSGQEFTIEYKPQKHFELGAKISAGAIALIAVTLLSHSAYQAISARKSKSQG